MDYISFPEKLIYRERERLEDFDVKNNKSLNFILETELHKLYYTKPGYKSFALNILNTAYYICTMVKADDDPTRNYGDYLAIIEKKMLGSEDDVALVLSMVSIIIDAYKWNETKTDLGTFALQLFYEIEKHNHIRYAYYEQAKNHFEWRAYRTTLCPDSEFERRSINYRLLADTYSVEDLRSLFGTDEKKVKDFVSAIGKDEEEQYIIASFLEDQMYSFFPDGWRHKAFFDYIKSDIHNTFHGEEERAIENAEFEKQQEEDAINYMLIQDAKERIPQLEAEVKRLREELARKNNGTIGEQISNQPEPSSSEITKLKACNKELQEALNAEKEKNVRLEEEISELQGPVENLSASQNVRLELALQLLRAAGMDDKMLDSQNRKKATIARLLMLLTDIRSNNARNHPEHSCAKYLSDRDYLTKENKELVIQINNLCVDLGVNANLNL